MLLNGWRLLLVSLIQVDGHMTKQQTIGKRQCGVLFMVTVEVLFFLQVLKLDGDLVDAGFHLNRTASC